MKMLIGFLTLAVSFSTLASNGESKTFVYDGSQNSVELSLKGVKTHTEYKVETRPSVCYRTEVVGQRTVCSGGGYGGGWGGGYGGGWGGGRFPGPRYPRGPIGGSCWSEPMYRQVSYACTETVRTPFEVKDFDVDAKVLVDVTKVNSVLASVETLKVTLNGDALSMEVVGSGKFLVVLKKQDVHPAMNGSVKMIDGLFAVELVEAAPALKAVAVSDLAMENGILSFSVGPVANRANLGLSLNVTQAPILGSNTVLFDRELNGTEAAVAVTRDGSEATVDFSKIGVALSGGRFLITAKAFVKTSGKILNAAQFADSLETSKTLIFKIR